jgi:hypothetical protein
VVPQISSARSGASVRRVATSAAGSAFPSSATLVARRGVVDASTFAEDSASTTTRDAPESVSWWRTSSSVTDICVISGDEVRYTRPFDLSRCLFDGPARASAVVDGQKPRATLLQTTDYIRHSTAQGTNALVGECFTTVGGRGDDATRRPSS